MFCKLRISVHGSKYRRTDKCHCHAENSRLANSLTKKTPCPTLHVFSRFITTMLHPQPVTSSLQNITKHQLVLKIPLLTTYHNPASNTIETVSTPDIPHTKRDWNLLPESVVNRVTPAAFKETLGHSGATGGGQGAECPPRDF